MSEVSGVWLHVLQSVLIISLLFYSKFTGPRPNEIPFRIHACNPTAKLVQALGGDNRKLLAPSIELTGGRSEVISLFLLNSRTTILAALQTGSQRPCS